jgi:hypothetical protein
MRELLEEWQSKYGKIFRVIFCVGSRWNNIHFAVKKKSEYVAPPLPEGFHSLKDADLVRFIFSFLTFLLLVSVYLGMD